MTQLKKQRLSNAMAIEQRKCVKCGAMFYGSKNKLTCSNACKQKKYRDDKNEHRKASANGPTETSL